MTDIGLSETADHYNVILSKKRKNLKQTLRFTQGDKGDVILSEAKNL